jgi:hypothetical protein
MVFSNGVLSESFYVDSSSPLTSESAGGGAKTSHSGQTGYKLDCGSITLPGNSPVATPTGGYIRGNPVGILG